MVNEEKKVVEVEEIEKVGMGKCEELKKAVKEKVFCDPFISKAKKVIIGIICVLMVIYASGLYTRSVLVETYTKGVHDGQVQMMKVYESRTFWTKVKDLF